MAKSSESYHGQEDFLLAVDDVLGRDADQLEVDAALFDELQRLHGDRR